MKGLVQFIKEGVDRMLHDLKELIPESPLDETPAEKKSSSRISIDVAVDD